MDSGGGFSAATEGQPYGRFPQRTSQQSKNVITNLLVTADLALLAENLQKHLTTAQSQEYHKCVAMATATIHTSTKEIGQLIKRNKHTHFLALFLLNLISV